MAKYILKRVLSAIPTLFGIIIIVFVLMRVVGGSPVQYMLEEDATQEEIDALEAKYGLNEPIWKQFIIYCRDILTGNWGDSYFNRKPVFGNIAERLEPTLMLSLMSTFITVCIGIPAGIMAATHRNSLLDYGISFTSIGFLCIPNFWLGMILLYVFGWKLGIFPVQGYHSIAKYGLGEAVYYLLLPAIMSGLNHVASLARQTRSYMLDVLNEDYIRTAKAKGLSVFKVRYKHGLKNTLSLVTTQIATSVIAMLGGSTITENIFNINGVGKFAYDSLMRRDYSQEQAILIYMSVLYIGLNIVMDIIYKLIDPRVDFS